MISSLAFRSVCVAVLLVALVSAAPRAAADSWDPPTRQTTLSANKAFRVTIIPPPIAGEPVDEEDAADVAKGVRRRAPIAKVERRGAAGTWALVWRKTIVNTPTRALLSNDGTRLVTFDNWGRVGYGDDVVVVYDARGDLVRKLSLDQILPPTYVSHLPRSVSSRWWGRQHRLVDEDRFVELQIVEPGIDTHAPGPSVPLRIRLADGAVQPGSGEAWQRALAKAEAMQRARQAAWDAFRAMRAKPLAAPTGEDTEAWRTFLSELAQRFEREEGDWPRTMVLAAPGQEDRQDSAREIANIIKHYDAEAKFRPRLMLFASPTSDRLATLLEPALSARREAPLRGLRIVFVGKAEEGKRIAWAARAAGADMVLVDAAKPYPPGPPLPEHPPSDWEPRE